ncbi:MAG: family 20 glycosylhydrolase [Alistipes finegoldii]
MDEVLTEVLELFPSKYIHIGGDEADRTNLKSLSQMPASGQGVGRSGPGAMLSGRTRRKVSGGTRTHDDRMG